MDAELIFNNLPPDVIRKMLRQMIGKKGKSDEEKEKDIDKADKEREDLASMHAQSRGGAPEIPVTKDDIPESLRDALESDDEDEDEDASVAKKSAKKGRR